MTDPLAAAALAGESADTLLSLDVPGEYLAAHIKAEDVAGFRTEPDKDVRKTIHLGEVPMPELAPDEVLVAVMASSINFNTVWSAMFEPVSTFDMLNRFARTGGYTTRHRLPYQVIGSDASGVIVRTGAGVRNWSVGDHVTVSPVVVDDQSFAAHDDAMRDPAMTAWGYETNFGGLAHYTVVRASQILPKPAHLTWEEAACINLCGGTAYRMLVSDNGARIKQGDLVLIWGVTGGLGAFAAQLVRNGGGIPIGVVSSDEKVALAKRLGCEVVINRRELDLGSGDRTPEETAAAAKRLGRAIRAELGEDPHIAFDYTGKDTFGLSVIVVRRGGTVITCGSSSGYRHDYDNRYLWMNLKRILGSHAMNLHEAHEMLRLFELGRIAPPLSVVHPLSEVAEAAYAVQTNQHVGKVGVLGIAPHEGLGVTDTAKRQLLGEDFLSPLRLDHNLAGVG
ncbi:crotonyl-CoA reductase [Gordonia effusa NBRC 100432]|uniref:Crotonyl-CoA reductase n=1 Tax=Gordonia effusa NBRC 100432 TaxID=1077974 RepID=H0R6L4_9ACTN|nr:crotonyl-CoA carboxylase/reductase [Gordonia effusa]GAB20715.1 crotonyl-CoA reductase [Gordonia effusa NBRC 100432]